jgi:hypothetical protein
MQTNLRFGCVIHATIWTAKKGDMFIRRCYNGPAEKFYLTRCWVPAELDGGERA